MTPMIWGSHRLTGHEVLPSTQPGPVAPHRERTLTGNRTRTTFVRPVVRAPNRREKPIMGERMLRGSRLGAISYESDRNTELAPRQTREYLCVKGHQFEVPFAVDAE